MAVVSVIIPTYNGEEFISQAIESILNQESIDHQDIEIIIVDDGSTDRTLEIACNYPCEIVKLERKSGVACARNVGIKKARGDLIAFLDQDDIFLPHKLAVSLNTMRKIPELEFLYSDVIVYDEIRKTSWKIEYPFGERRNLLIQLFFGVIGIPSCWIIRKTAFDKIGYFDEEIYGSDDWDMMFRIVRKLNYMKLQTTTTIYRLHKGNTHRRNIEEIRKNQEKILLKAIRSIPPDELFGSDREKIRNGYMILSRDIKRIWRNRFMFYPKKVVDEIEKKIASYI